MEFLANYGLFLAKTATVVIGILIILVAGISLGQRQRHRKGELEITNITERMEQMLHQLRGQLMDKHQLKAAEKARKKARKEKEKAQKEALKQAAKAEKEAKAEPVATAEPSAESEQSEPAEKDQDTKEQADKRLFVLDFNGSMDAHEVESLREEVTAVVSVAEAGDEVLLRLESPGGAAHAYGLAASQLERLKAKELKLTVAIDKVAASGGYMMACVADHIAAAPFSIIGSIGVVAQMPNIHRLLKKHDVDVELHTAGEYKRTLTMLGENDEAGRAKFKEQLEEAHQLFKQHVEHHRPQMAISEVATGEHWFARKALEKGLVDELATSDDLLLRALEQDEMTIYRVQYHGKTKLRDKLSQAASLGFERALKRVLLRDPASNL